MHSNIVEYLRVQRGVKVLLGHNMRPIQRPIYPLHVQALGTKAKTAKKFNNIFLKEDVAGVTTPFITGGTKA